MPSSSTPICYLFDNGSLRPAATLSLRRIAAGLAQKLPGTEVRPVSLLHSSGVAAEALEGRRAELLEPALVAAGGGGLGEAVLVPLFFGPSDALTSYLPERIEREDVQTLLRKVIVRPSAQFSRRFPAEMPVRIQITMDHGQVLTKEKRDYEGFLTRPMGWNTITKKFEQLTQARLSPPLQREIEQAVANLENIQVSELMRLLGNIK